MMIWLTIAGMAVVTLATRALPLLVMRGEPPAWLGRWLGLVPVSVFTALALRPLVVSAGPDPRLAIGAPLAAGLAGALVAWRTSSVVATIAAGMAAYWALRLLGV
ncbi:MAG: AzlD domain-containing protein [Chloroflexales bacterium]|nr:AzlD domain-containing protein [Chloroflexales bacterium]